MSSLIQLSWCTSVGSRAAATSKMECFLIIVNGFQPLTSNTKRSILDVAAFLDLPLCTILFKLAKYHRGGFLRLGSKLLCIIYTNFSRCQGVGVVRSNIYFQNNFFHHFNLAKNEKTIWFLILVYEKLLVTNVHRWKCIITRMKTIK